MSSVWVPSRYLRQLHSTVLIAFILFGSTVAQPQTSASTPAPQTNAQPKAADAPATTLRVHVDQVLLRVVVTDDKGRPVGDLKKDDFRIVDQGRPQFITGFSRTEPAKITEPASKPAAKSPAEQTPVAKGAFPDRHIIYVFDDRHLDFGSLAALKRALDHQLPNILGPNDRIAVQTTSNNVHLGFTSNRAEVLGAVARIQPRPLSVSKIQCPYMSYALAAQILDHEDSWALSGAVQDYRSCSGGSIGGDRAGSGGMTCRGSTNPDVMVVCGRVFDALAMGNFETHDTLRTLTDMVNRLKSTVGQRSVVFVSPGFYIRDQHQELERIIESASRSGVVIHTLDLRGVATNISYTAEARLAPTGGLNYFADSAQQEGAVLGELAESTGGTWFRGNNNMDLGLKRTSEVPEVVYLLAFSPEKLKADGSFHKLKVTVEKPGRYLVQTRRGYFAPNSTPNPKTIARRDIEDALYSHDEIRGIPVTARSEFYRAGDETVHLSVLSHIDLKPVEFRRDGQFNTAQLTLVTGIFDWDGQLLSAKQNLIEFRLTDQKLDEQRRDGAVMKSAFELKPGNYHVRVVVRDQDGQQLSATNLSVIPDPKDPSGLTAETKQVLQWLSAPDTGKLKAAMQTPYFFTGANTARVNLTMETVPQELKYREVEGKLRASLNVLGIAYKGDGTIGAAFSDTITRDFESKQQFEDFRSQPLTYSKQFELASGQYTFKLVFGSDGVGSEASGAEGGGFGRLESTLNVDAYDAQRFQLSSLVLSRRTVQMANGDAELKVSLAADESPLLLHGFQVVPSVSNKFKFTDKVVVYSQIYEPQMTSDTPPILVMKYRVLDPVSGQVKLDSGLVNVSAEAKKGVATIPVGFVLPIDKLAPGKYVLKAQAADSTGKTSAQRGVEFEVE